MPVRREVEVEATPEEVWEAIATEQGRERWLEHGQGREVHVEEVEQPHRLVWWWQGEERQPPTRVEFLIVASPAGARVVVTESVPTFPLPALAASFAGVLA